jgi:hypothetical protein
MLPFAWIGLHKGVHMNDSDSIYFRGFQGLASVTALRYGCVASEQGNAIYATGERVHQVGKGTASVLLHVGSPSLRPPYVVLSELTTCL